VTTNKQELEALLIQYATKRRTETCDHGHESCALTQGGKCAHVLAVEYLQATGVEGMTGQGKA
jgi:hypothetical protein